MRSLLIRVAFLLTAFVVVVPARISAQVLGAVPSSSPLPIGALVRVTLTSHPTDERVFAIRVPRQVIAQVAAIAPDTLYLIPVWGSAAVPVARDRVALLHVSRGVSRLRSAGMGALGGALYGASLDYLVAQPALRGARPLHAHYTIGVGFVGMVAGALWPSESWRRVRRY